MLPILLFLFATIGVPLLWLFFDLLQKQKATRSYVDSPMPRRAVTPDRA